MNKVQMEYDNNIEFIKKVVENKEINNYIRMTDHKMYLVTLQNAYEDVKQGYSIFANEGDIQNCITKLKENSYLWEVLS